MKYFTVGPSQTHALFKKHIDVALKMNVPSVSHRSAYFTEMYADLAKHVKKLFKAPTDFETVFLFLQRYP